MRKKKKKVSDEDWEKVAYIIRGSVRGESVGEEKMQLIIRALHADPERYKALHAELKEEAIAEMRRW